MAERTIEKIQSYDFRAKLPKILRYAALVAAGLIVVVVVASFYTARSKPAFKLKPEHAHLSTDVIAEVSGYERTESDGTTPKYYIKADTARTFSDNHQELENAYVKVFAADGQAFDEINADKAIYVPEADKNFTAYLAGNVKINTRDALKIETDGVTYTRATETAESDDKILFDRDNIRGTAIGATVKMAEKKLELRENVEVETFESAEKKAAGVKYAKLNAASAIYDQNANSIELNGGFKAKIESAGRTSDVSAGRAIAWLSGAETSPEGRELTKLELFENVHIVSNDGKTTTIDAGNAVYEKPLDRYQLSSGARIVTEQDSRKTEIQADSAVYDRKGLKATLNGSAQVAQGSDYVKGDTIIADLFSSEEIKHAVVSGNTFLKQTTRERLTQASANELTIDYAAPDQLRTARAVTNARAELVPTTVSDYSKATLTTPRSITIDFKGKGLLAAMHTDGRTTIQLDAPGNAPDAATKRVTADTVKTYFHDNGQDISKAEAVGDAVLEILPVKKAAEIYNTTVNAPRFDCEFFPTGNNARECIGGTGAKTVRKPTVAAPGSGDQLLTSDKVIAAFDSATKDLSELQAAGNAKFSELDRRGLAERFVFSQNDKILRLRGGEPTVWDDRSRAKASEIDWNTATQISSLRGGVSTTFYNGGAMGGASPFSSTNKPVFITSVEAVFDRNSDTAVYTGNARAWQDDNYVRADKLTILQGQGKLVAEGSVQSGLYDAKINRAGKESRVPVFASANALTYARDGRTLSYRGNVDIRQASDRITAESADIFLSEKSEVTRTVAERSVVLTQPGRRATGDRVEYSAETEIAVLDGSPAMVSDAENGSSSGSQITVYFRENRFVGSRRGRQNPNSRVKSVYKTADPQE
ncbi:MAG: LPS export ABC transporter periplasmic protein LptC [Acidobacteria bacterium]|nr:LPS export ABC transporter periplasmic protein LptC [Acidobacteriota bacterium]